MSEIRLHVPDETLAALEVTPEQLASELRLAAAIKLYELGRLSSGAAAILAESRARSSSSSSPTMASTPSA